MKQERKEQIEHLAYSIRELCSIKGPIANMQTVLNYMGARIVPVPFEELSRNGRMSKRGDKFAIRHLDRLDNVKEVNWLVARTLGHIILHLGWSTDLKRWTSLPDGNFFVNPDIMQAEEADYFAMELLLPEDLLEPMFEVATVGKDEIGFDDLDILSDYFMVPTVKIFNRLTDLDLIE